MGPDPPGYGKGLEVWEGARGQQGPSQKQREGGLSNVVYQCPVCGRSQKGEGRHRMLGEANMVASGREDGARVVNSPDASMAREVNDIRNLVIAHERTSAVWGFEPISQRH